jgi:hypothetical protein
VIKIKLTINAKWMLFLNIINLYANLFVMFIKMNEDESKPRTAKEKKPNIELINIHTEY